MLAALFGAAAIAQAAPFGYSVRSDTDRKLYRIDLATGFATAIGATGFSKIEGMAVGADGQLYGVNPSTAQLVRCSGATGACTAVGQLAGLPQLQTNAGLAFTTDGQLYLAMNAVIYRVDAATGATTSLGGSGPALSGLAGVTPSAICPSGLFGMGGNTDRGKFYCINVSTGAATLLGTVGVSPLDVGLDGDASTGLVWGVSNDNPGQVFAVAPETLAVSNVSTVTLAGVPIGGFESLAVAPAGQGAAGDAADAAVVPTLGVSALALMAALTALLGANTIVRRGLRHIDRSIRK
ncbi:MAG: hypothetical protein JNL19_06890 [Burkholderiales bacterium]|nr:hypothetical protein [Burkholderiales bacterium]